MSFKLSSYSLGFFLLISSTILLFCGLVLVILSTGLLYLTIVPKIYDTNDSNIIINDENLKLLILYLGLTFIFVSIMGILCIFCVRKCIIQSYLILSTILLIIHFVIVIILVTLIPKLRIEIDLALNKTILVLNNNSFYNETIKTIACEYMKTVSGSLSCCGSQSQMDFYNKELSFKCCKFNSQIGCSQVLFSNDKSFAEIQLFIFILYFPNILMLIVELLNIITMSCVATNIELPIQIHGQII